VVVGEPAAVVDVADVLAAAGVGGGLGLRAVGRAVALGLDGRVGADRGAAGAAGRSGRGGGAGRAARGAAADGDGPEHRVAVGDIARLVDAAVGGDIVVREGVAATVEVRRVHDPGVVVGDRVGVVVRRVLAVRLIGVGQQGAAVESRADARDQRAHLARGVGERAGAA